MRYNSADDIPNVEKLLELNPHLDKELKVKKPVDPVKQEIKLEKELQKQVENYLQFRNYERMTADNVAANRPGVKGLFVHQHVNKRNAFLPDIVVFDRDGRYLMVELKRSHKARYRPGQLELINDWKICGVATTLEEFMKIFLEWEQGIMIHLDDSQ